MSSAPRLISSLPRLPPLADRRAMEREQSREAILSAAQEQIRRDGVGALNLRKVAAMVGFKPSSLHDYFDGREAIYVALHNRAGERFQECIMRHLEGTKTFEESVRAIFAAFRRFAQDAPELFRLLFEYPTGFTPSDESIARREAGHARGRDHLRRALEHDGIELPIAVDQALALIDVTSFGLTAAAMRTDTGYHDAAPADVVSALLELLVGSRRERDAEHH